VGVALGDLRAALQFLIIRVLDTQCAANLVDDVLIRRRVVAAGSFVAGGFGRLPVGIDVARGDGAGASG
jgi:hypothetical protein